MLGTWIPTLLALALWLYGLYLALTRTKSPTAKGVTLAALIGLFLAFGGFDLALVPGPGGYPHTLEKTRTLPPLKGIVIALTNAEVVVGPGSGRLRLVEKAKTAAALARMHPSVRVTDGRLQIIDDHQPKGTAYRIELDLPSPVAARISLTNGALRAEDRLSALWFSATNGDVRLANYRPTGPTTLAMTNGEVRILGFAPEAPTRIDLTNGEVTVRAEKPLKVKARVTNGAIRLPDRTRAAAGGSEATYGPEQAPPLTVRILNGEVDYREGSP